MITSIKLFSLVAAAFLALSCDEKPTIDVPAPEMPKPVEPNKPSEEGGSGIEISVMSFNVRYPASSDTDEKAWSYRLNGVKAMLTEKDPDLIGVQECYPRQRIDIINLFPQYEFYGVLRSDGTVGTEKSASETTTIFYKKDKFELVDKGTFWLSETPDKASTGWDATIKRTTTWVLLKEKTSGNKFYFFNTHLDHKGVQAQNEGAKLIRARMESMNKAGLPVLLTGDMNVEQNNNVLLNFKMDNIRKTAPVTDTKVTCHGYGSKSQRIDHIFYEGFIPHKFETINQTWEGMKYISDHNPVMAVVEF